jgi:hypothetical protein
MHRACSTKGGEEERIYVTDGKTRRKEPIGRPRHRWVDNIKMNLGMKGWGGVDCIGLEQDMDEWWTLVNAVMNIRVP